MKEPTFTSLIQKHLHTDMIESKEDAYRKINTAVNTLAKKDFEKGVKRVLQEWSGQGELEQLMYDFNQRFARKEPTEEDYARLLKRAVRMQKKGSICVKAEPTFAWEYKAYLRKHGLKKKDLLYNMKILEKLNPRDNLFDAIKETFEGKYPERFFSKKSWEGIRARYGEDLDGDDQELKSIQVLTDGVLLRVAINSDGKLLVKKSSKWKPTIDDLVMFFWGRNIPPFQLRKKR